MSLTEAEAKLLKELQDKQGDPEEEANKKRRDFIDKKMKEDADKEAADKAAKEKADKEAADKAAKKKRSWI